MFFEKNDDDAKVELSTLLWRKMTRGWQRLSFCGPTVDEISLSDMSTVSLEESNLSKGKSFDLGSPTRLITTKKVICTLISKSCNVNIGKFLLCM